MSLGLSRRTARETYLENGDELEKAAQMANQSSDRCADEVTSDEVERINI